MGLDKVAWTILLNRYNDPCMIKKRHIQALLRQSKMDNSDVNSLQKTVDEIQRNILVLEQLGEPVKDISSFLIEILSEKLDSVTLAAWEVFQAEKKANFQGMLEFLHKRARLLETIAVEPTRVPGTSNRALLPKGPNKMSVDNVSILCKEKPCIL